MAARHRVPPQVDVRPSGIWRTLTSIALRLTATDIPDGKMLTTSNVFVCLKAWIALRS